jgi:hypothetical protein
MPATLTARKKRLAVSPLLIVSGCDIREVPFTERTYALDVAAGGLSFETPHNVTVGTPLTIRIHLPRPLRHRFAGRPVYGVRGVVARVERVPDTGRYRVGVRFVSELSGAA